MKLVFLKKEKQAGNAWTFSFHPEKPVEWKPGQYIRLDMSEKEKDQRYFTISNAPSEKDIAITTRIYAKNRSAFKDALFALEPEKKVHAIEPEGDFTVHDHKEPHIFIAGGIGITPFRSILIERDAQEEAINATLLYAHGDNEPVFGEELETLTKKHRDFNIHHFTDTQIDADVIRKVVPHIGEATFFISGPQPFVEQLYDMLAKMEETDPAHIKRDDFPGYPWNNGGDSEK